MPENTFYREFTIPRITKLVQENTFVQKEAETCSLPSFEEIQTMLPKPIWNHHPDVIACYYRAWEIAFGNLRTPTPGSGFVSNFIDTAFNDCLFMWDSAFILMFGKYANRIFNFQKTLDNLYAHQHPDGFICREISEKTGEDRFARHDPSATGPEVMAWSEWEYFLNFGDTERLAKVFSPLMAYHRWMREHHTWPDGSYFSSGWGCGMDNVPRMMEGYSPEFSHGHMIWVDACMQEVFNCNILMEMAQVLGRMEFVDELTDEKNHLTTLINDKLWQEETGFYYDLWRNGQHNMVRHVGAFWSLIAECAPKERAARLIAYLEDEKEFKTPHRVPTLSQSHPEFAPEGQYWRGAVWSPTNYMILKGLDQYGRYDLSYSIAKEHVDALVDVFRRHQTLFENYTSVPNAAGNIEKGTPAKRDFVGWTGLSAISILFEFVFGIKPNVIDNKITWHINLLDAHGIEQYPFGKEGLLTLRCAERTKQEEKPNVTVSSNVPVTVEVIWGEGTSQRMEITV